MAFRSHGQSTQSAPSAYAEAIQEASRKRRGPQKVRPTKQPVTMRLSPDVLAVLRGTGRGWQTLVDDTLREHFVTGPAKRP